MSDSFIIKPGSRLLSFFSLFNPDTLEQAASLLGIGMPSVTRLLGSVSVAIVARSGA